MSDPKVGEKWIACDFPPYCAIFKVLELPDENSEYTVELVKKWKFAKSGYGEIGSIHKLRTADFPDVFIRWSKEAEAEGDRYEKEDKT